MRRYFGLDPSKNWTKEELIQYDNSLIAEQDKRGRLIAAYKRGKMKAEKRIIIRCSQLNIPIEDISDIIDLPIEKVQQIIQNH